jgi:hypothetical protein
LAPWVRDYYIAKQKKIASRALASGGRSDAWQITWTAVLF